MRKTAVVLGLLLAVSLHAASAPELVRDFRSPDEPESSYPEHFFSTGGRAFFFADDGRGYELWTSDGTAAGTQFLAELTPGPEPDRVDPEPRFVASGDLVYFWHFNELDEKAEVWRTDGTPLGTFPVLRGDWWYNGRIAPFGERGAIVAMEDLHVIDGETVTSTIDIDFFPGSMVSLGGAVYGVSGDVLWRTDGTSVEEIRDFDGGLDDTQLVVHGGALHLIEGGEGNTANFWRTDGSAAGTTLIVSFELEDWPRLLATDDGVFALIVRGETTHVIRLGTSATLVKAVPGVYEGELAAAGSDFFAFQTDDPRLLYRSDGTEAGTIAITDDFNRATVTRTHVVYEASSGVWVHDGTASARLLTPLRPWNDLEVAQVGERFVLPLEDEEHGVELWISDASTSGTTLLKNLRPEGHSEGSLARRVNDTIFFRAHSDEHGLEPWVLDEEGLRVLDVDTGPDSSHPTLFTEVNGRLLFISDPEPNHPSQFRVTDGTGLHTIMSYDFTPFWRNDAASFPVVGDRVFLFGYGDGDEVWTTDGTIENTQRGTSLPWLDYDFDPVTANGVAFFVSDSALWRTDGTLAGTYALASDVRQMHATPSKLFFVAYGSAHGMELWVSDGTLAGTHVVKDIRPGREDAFWFRNDLEIVFQTFGDAIVFAADDGVHGEEPWFSDGTEAGTFLLRDVAPGTASSMVPRFDREVTAAAGGFVYFAADDGVHGRELWRTDGTPEGTKLVHDIARGRASSIPMRMRAIGDRVYFSADDGVHGREPWWSSLAGTGLLTDVAAGADASQPHDMTELGGWIYFFAMTEATGDELWRVAAPRPKRRAAR